MTKTRTSGIVALAIVVESCATTGWAQALCDSFKPDQTQYWTGWLDYNGGTPTKHDDAIKWCTMFYH